MRSEKGKPLLICDNYKYRFKRELKNEIQRWDCANKTCRCYLKINSSNIIVESFRDHNHDKLDVKTINRQKLENSLKRKAIQDISSKPSKLVHEELKEGDVETLSSGDVELVKRVIRRARRSVHPNLPKSRHETHSALDTMSIVTNTGESFLLINNSQKELICFSCIRNLNVLCETQKLYVDGTFKSCPKYFTQIFTLHGFVNDLYIPLVFFLLPDKSTNTYTNMFKALVEKCESHNLHLCPNEMYIDFEVAIHNAARIVWPTINIKGCRFHLGQNWWKKIQTLGLSRQYKNSKSEKGKFLKLFFGLPFLHPGEVDDCFTDDLMSLKPKGEKIQSFMDYIFDNYISPDAVFPPSVWAEFSASTNRTTNGCESFHAKFNGYFYTAHPNVYNFIEILKNIQSETYIKLRSSNSLKKHKKLLEQETHLRKEMLRFSNRNCSRLEYVETVSLKFLPIT